jgi:hypothetical protein
MDGLDAVVFLKLLFYAISPEVVADFGEGHI